MDARATKPSRLRRYAKRAGIALGVLLGLIVVMLAGVLFSLRFAAVRSFVVARVNGALDGTFKGRLVLHGVGNLGLSALPRRMPRSSTPPVTCTRHSRSGR